MKMIIIVVWRDALWFKGDIDSNKMGPIRCEIFFMILYSYLQADISTNFQSENAFYAVSMV